MATNSSITATALFLENQREDFAEPGQSTASMQKLMILFIGCLGLIACMRPDKGSRMQESAEIQAAITALRGAYAAFNRGDMDAAVKPLDDDIEWTEPAEFPGGGTYHGHQGVKTYLTQSRVAWAEVSSEPERFIPAGDRIVVLVHARVRPKGSNEWQDVRLADVYTMRSGKAVQMRAFSTREEALRWVGIQDRNNK